MSDTSPTGVVVGVDGSAPSVVALRWAAKEAELRHTDLTAVIVDAEIVPAPYAPVRSEPIERRRAELRRVLDEAIAAAVGSHPSVVVHQHVEEGRPAEILARYAKHAELLVLGNREHGRVAASLAPTIRGCIRRAACHVVVVRDEDGDEQAPATKESLERLPVPALPRA